MSYDEIVEGLAGRTLAFRDPIKGIRMQAKIVSIEFSFESPFDVITCIPEGREYRSKYTCYRCELERLASGQEVDRSKWHMENLLIKD